MFVGILEGDVTTDAKKAIAAEDKLKQILTDEQIGNAFTRIIVTETPDTAFQTLFQVIGLGALRPNTCLFEWKEDWDTDSEGTINYMKQIQAVVCSEKALIVVRDSEDRLPHEVLQKGFIDVWWVVHDGGLLILLPHLLKLNKVWSSCEIRLFGVVMNSRQKASVEENINEYLERLRITATVLVVDLSMTAQTTDVDVKTTEKRKSALKIREESMRNLDVSPITNTMLPQEDEKKIQAKRRVSYTSRTNEATLAAQTLNAQMRALSSDADLVLTNFPVVNGVDVVDFMSYVDVLSSGLPPCLLVRGSGYDVMTADG